MSACARTHAHIDTYSIRTQERKVQFREHRYLKQLMAVTLLTIDAKKAIAVVRDVTNMEGTACLMVSRTKHSDSSSENLCRSLDRHILQYINASSAPIPANVRKLSAFVTRHGVTQTSHSDGVVSAKKTSTHTYEMLTFPMLIPMATTTASRFIKGKNRIRKTRVYTAYEMPRLNTTAKIVATVKITEPVYAQMQSVTNAKPASNKLESDTNSRSNSVLFRPNCMPCTRIFPYVKSPFLTSVSL